MTRKEINEIKSQYTLEDCAIARMSGCYVDGEKNKVTKINEIFLNLPEEEKHKYLIFSRKHCQEHRVRISWICSLQWIHTLMGE